MKKILSLLLIVLITACTAPLEQSENTVDYSISDESETQTIQANKHIKVETSEDENIQTNVNVIDTIDQSELEKTIETKQIETIKKEPKQIEESTENPINEFLKQLPEKYWYHDIEKEIGAVVVGNKKMDAWRFVGNHIEPGLYYWDYPDSRDIYIFYDEVNMYQLQKEVREKKESLPDVNEYKLGFVKQTIKDYKYPKSPVKWMEEFKDKTPTKIDKTAYAIKINEMMFTSKLGIHFTDSSGTETILRFDDIYHVPAVIEIRKNSRLVKQYKYYFDEHMADIHNWRITAEITDDLADLPENHVIITMDEVEKIDDLKPSYMRKRISMKTRVIEIMEDFQGKTDTTQRASI
ncbi:hypothetical protein KY304_02885 [Candidatus Woesearchaeota archaeon]|nr:hypothetical protein [Candidatus Woesearchaeota archaeon]